MTTPAETPASEIVTLHDEEGRIAQQSSRKDGVLNGETVLYLRGRVQARLQFVNGEQSGESVYFDESGRVTTRANYLRGKLHGESSYYNQDGKLVRRSLFENGDMHGRTIDYFPATGKTREISNYKTNLLDGELVRFTEEGKLEDRQCFKAGIPTPCPPLKMTKGPNR